MYSGWRTGHPEYGQVVSNARKRKLITRLVAQVEGEIATMRKAALDAAEGATHEEAKPENDKDTRAIEASYLAAGQAERVRQMDAGVKRVAQLELLEFPKGAPIAATAVVTVEDEEGEQAVYFVLPHFGGVVLEGEAKKKVQVVTPPSPLGTALLGRMKDDVIELRVKAGKRELTIVDVW